MGGLKRILIADDEKINRKMLNVIFGDGYDIIDAENGEQVIELIRELGGDIDLLLLDLSMPKMTGFEVLDYLRTENMIQQIPIIIITSSIDSKDELRAYNYGAAEIIHKPFVPEIVLRRSENLIELYAGRKNLAMQLAERTAELQNTRKYDTLTGLLNMKQFLSSADKILRESDDESCREYSFIYSNIRNFKYFNVKYNMEHGDLLLKELAAKIQKLSDTVLFSRFGQDHFVAMTKEKNPQKWIEKVNNYFESGFSRFGMHIKAGLYRVRGAGERAYSACDNAKIACDSIRNQQGFICEYDDKLGRYIDISTYVLQNIDKAIRKRYIKVYYQPVVRTISGKTCGMEALARWIDPEKGFLSPDDFISQLEENRQITKLDLYILREICREMCERTANGKPVVPVSFNLSRIDFQECDIFSEVEKIVSEYGISHDMINVEITESTIMEDPDALMRDIKRFRDGGYQVWMDDFGSGYSSLNVLKDYEFDEIKLDMKFMSSFDERSKKIVKSIISMAKQIGVQTLAEGVETQEQFDFLRYIGCEKVQGYFFSRPLPSEQLEKTGLAEPENMEPSAMKGYYNSIGVSDFVTNRPLAIVEYDGKDMKFKYINSEFQDVLDSLGGSDMEMVYNNINSPASPISKQFRDLQETCHLGAGVKQIIYTVRNQYVRLRVKCLAEHENMSAYEAEIINLTIGESKSYQLDQNYRMISSIFDLICRIDLVTGKLDMLRYGSYGDEIGQKLLNAENKVMAAREIASSLIAEEERAAYLDFCDPKTLKERVSREKRGTITKFFRTLTKDGSYVWKTHTIMYNADSNSIIYCTRFAPITEDGFTLCGAP